MRYWDFGIPSAVVTPTELSKYNTALQLLLVGATTVSPLLPMDVATPLFCLQSVVSIRSAWSKADASPSERWATAATTVGSGMSYLFSNKAIKYIK